MGVVFNMYPLLNEEHIDKLGYQSEKLELLYKEDFDFYPLVIDNINHTGADISGELKDPRCTWYPDTHNLMIRKPLSIGDSSVLFGENGIAPVTAEIGVAIRWISAKSDHCGTIPVGSFSVLKPFEKTMFEYTFEKCIIKGSLILQTVLYLKSVGEIKVNEKHLAHNTGTILGTLDNTQLYVDGNGSVFPVATVSDASKPLWWVYYDDSCDPLQDQFDEEFVEIRLNRAHPCYEALKIEDSLKESPLFLEVISSALLIIVESVKETLGPDWDTILTGQGFARGSIAEAMYYFIVKLNWDISSPSRLAQSIHRFFDENLKGGTL